MFLFLFRQDVEQVWTFLSCVFSSSITTVCSLSELGVAAKYRCHGTPVRRLFRFVLQSVGAAFQKNIAKNAKMSSKSESVTVVGYVVPGVQQLLGLKQIMQLLCAAATIAKPCKQMISPLRKAAFLVDARFSSSRDHIRHDAPRFVLTSRRCGQSNMRSSLTR